jgi:hypothetical protein
MVAVEPHIPSLFAHSNHFAIQSGGPRVRDLLKLLIDEVRSNALLTEVSLLCGLRCVHAFVIGPHRTVN